MTDVKTLCLKGKHCLWFLLQTPCHCHNSHMFAECAVYKSRHLTLTLMAQTSTHSLLSFHHLNLFSAYAAPTTSTVFKCFKDSYHIIFAPVSVHSLQTYYQTTSCIIYSLASFETAVTPHSQTDTDSAIINYPTAKLQINFDLLFLIVTAFSALASPALRAYKSKSDLFYFRFIISAVFAAVVFSRSKH